MRLDTNPALTEAISMYRSAGYRPIDAFNDEPYAQLWFEKALAGGLRRILTTVRLLPSAVRADTAAAESWEGRHTHGLSPS